MSNDNSKVGTFGQFLGGNMIILIAAYIVGILCHLVFNKVWPASMSGEWYLWFDEITRYQAIGDIGILAGGTFIITVLASWLPILNKGQSAGKFDALAKWHGEGFVIVEIICLVTCLVIWAADLLNKSSMTNPMNWVEGISNMGFWASIIALLGYTWFATFLMWALPKQLFSR